MEEMILSLFESSLIGGAFVYMLYYVTKNFKEALDKITHELNNISQSIRYMDKRIERIERMEKRGGGRNG